MGGKTSQSTSNLTVPENVKAMYNSATERAGAAANTPFQEYSQDPNAFVAGLTGTQQAAQQGVNAAQGMYQPYYDQATQSMYSGQQAANPLQAMAAQGYGGAYGQGQQYLGNATQFGLAGAQAVDPTQLGKQQIDQYMSPYLSNVLQSTLAPLQQQQAQQQSSLVGNQIGSGAFGGDRGKIAQAVLAGQQNMATSKTVSDLMNQGYGQALSTAQQQQGLGLGASQANRAALQQAAGQMAALGQQGYAQGMGTAQARQGLGQQVFGQGQAMAQGLQGLGSGALQNELAARQAQQGMGTVEQQTQQGGLQALYNQFLQKQGYPFQVSNFLTNQYAQLGPQYGTTTTQTKPTSIAGNILARGGVAQRKSGGLVPSSEGGAVSPEHAGFGFANGGASYSPELMAAILQGIHPYGSAMASRVGGGAGPLGTELMKANPRTLEHAEFDKPTRSSLDKILQAQLAYKQGKGIFDGNVETTVAPASYRGGVAGPARNNYAMGGMPYQTDTSYVPEETVKSKGLLDSDSKDGQSGHGIMDDAMKIMTIAKLFGAKRGGVAGRHGYALDGGVPNLFDPNAVPEEYTPEERAAYQADLTKRVEEESKDPDLVNRFWKSLGSVYAPHPSEDKTGTFLKDLGRGDPSGEFMQVDAAPKIKISQGNGLAPVPTENVPKRPEPEAAIDPVKQAPVEQAPVIGGLIPSAQAAAIQPPADARNLSNAVAGKDGNWFARNKDWLLPLAKGVGTTLEGRGGKFLPASLLKGAAAGALSVPGLQEQAAKVAEAQETPKTKQLSNAETALKLYLQYKYTASMRGETPVSWPEFAKEYGVIVPPGTQAPQGAEATAIQIPGKVDLLGNASNKAAQAEGQAVFGVNAEAAQKASQDYMTKVRNSGLAAAENTLNTNEMAKVVSKNIAGKGLNAPGTAFAARAELVRAINTTLHAFGSKETVGESDTQKDLSDKYAAFMGSGLASNADQNSLGALQAMMGALPQGGMTPAAQVQLATQLMVTNQQAKDRQAHINQYNEKTGGLNSYYNAQQAFEDDNRPRYLAEQEFLKRIMTSPNLMEALTSGVGTAGRMEMIFQGIAEKDGMKYIPGMSRYFVRQ